MHGAVFLPPASLKDTKNTKNNAKKIVPFLAAIPTGNSQNPLLPQRSLRFTFILSGLSLERSTFNYFQTKHFFTIEMVDPKHSRYQHDVPIHIIHSQGMTF